MNKPAVIVEALLDARRRTGPLTRNELNEVVQALAYFFDQDPVAVSKDAVGSGRLAQLLRAVFGIHRRRRTSDLDEKLLFASTIASKIASGMTQSEALRSYQDDLRILGKIVEFDALQKAYERLGILR